MVCNVSGLHVAGGFRVIDHMPAIHKDLAAGHGLLNGQLGINFQYIAPHGAGVRKMLRGCVTNGHLHWDVHLAHNQFL